LREGSEEVIRGEGAGGAAELIIPETATVRTREDFPKFHGNCPEPKPIFLDGLNIGDKVGDEVSSVIGAVNLEEGAIAQVVAAPEAEVKVEAGGEARNLIGWLFEEEFGESFGSHGDGERRELLREIVIVYYYHLNYYTNR
jgi:hypothetical protein